MTMIQTDTPLQKAVLDELAWEPSVTAAHIGVAAHAGIVTLTGHVDSYAQKHAAETAARRVAGVQAVAEEIEVRLAFEAQRSDEEIAAAVVNRIDWNAAVPRNAIKVQVESGWVTLSGEVQWDFQRKAAAHEVRWLFGVVGVSNQVTLKTGGNDVQVREELMHALYRSCSAPQNITVTLEAGTLRLGGTVRGLRDRDLAETAAWSAPGVIAVQNHITICA
jgi:osmotically-inducible protein OsmY